MITMLITGLTLSLIHISAGYAKIARQAVTENQENIILNDESVKGISHVLGSCLLYTSTKAVTKYTKQLAEMRIYDEAIAHIANQRIEIDLDAVSYTHLDVYKRQGMVSQVFAFVETKQTAELMAAGMSKDEIKDKVIGENLCQLRNETRLRLSLIHI